MDVDLNTIGIVNSMNSISITENTDMTFIDNMKSLSLDIQSKFEPIETYYDYDRTNYDTNTHTYVETNTETNTEIIRENIEDDIYEIDEEDDVHEYDGYDGVYEYVVPDDVNNMKYTMENNMLDKYDSSPYVCFGIPNIYCQNYFDDEDFIYNRYDISNDIKKYIKINNSIDEYTSNYCIGNGIMIDYNNNNDNPDIIYAKILYIYTYINYYYKDLKDLPPSERIKHLPENLLYWIDNIVTIFKTVISNESLKSETFLSIEDVYFKELCYGLKIITNQLSLLLNHSKSYSLLLMEEKHIKTFFKILNNMCVIIIFMKLNNRP